ncbi:MAG TPA: TetR/AcrR family transcriptional regulator [Solirubrobacteraceae bacterium]
MSTPSSSIAPPKQARAQETLRKLLTAAVDELLQNGYMALSTSAVARRAGVSRGAQQNYFPHKQMLVMEAVRHLGRLQREAVRDRVQAVPSGRERVQAGLDVLFEAYGGPLFASVVELSLAARHDKVLNQVITSEERATSRAMQETASYIFGEDFPESREAAQRWATVLSAIRGLALLKLLGHPPAAVERQWTATRGQLLEVLAGTATPRQP